MTTAVATRYSIRDASGKVLCHSASQTKDGCDSRRKRAVREGFARMVEAAGMGTAGMVEDARGEKILALVGDVQDCITAAWLPMADGSQASIDMAVIERGHVVPDESDGAFCPCNLVPENRGSNKGHGKASLDPRMFRASDPREQWFAVWFQHYARPSQRRAAVRP